MIRRTLLIFVAIALMLGAPLAIRPSTGLAQADAATCADSEESALLQLINDYRAQNGLPALAFSQTLSVASDRHSRDMATNNIFSHTGSDGSSYVDRVTAAGYPDPATTAENIFGGSESAAGAIDWWKNSPPHNATMLNPNAKAVGIARVNNPNSQWRWYWTTVYGGTVDGAACTGDAAAVTVQSASAPTATATLSAPTATATVAAPTGDTQPTATEDSRATGHDLTDVAPTATQAGPISNAPAAPEQPTQTPTQVAPAAPEQPTQTPTQTVQAVAVEPTATAAETTAAVVDQPSATATLAQTQPTDIPAATATQAAAQPTATTGAPAASSCPSGEELAFIQAVNSYRAQNGLPPMSVSASLTTAARAQAQDMAANNLTSDVGSDGSTWVTRVTAAGYPNPLGTGDLFAFGSESGQTTFDSLKSGGSLDGMVLNPNNVAIGVARGDNPNSPFKHYWMVIIGNAADPATCAAPAAATTPSETPTATPTTESVAPTEAAAPAPTENTGTQDATNGNTQGTGGADTDGDGLTDDVEAQAGTSPEVSDSDGDGVSDGDEVFNGTDPLDPNSF